MQQRYRVVLNGFTVELPTRQLPRLLKLGFIAQVYPNVRYTLATNRSPDVIRAAAFSSLRGLRGEGMKIGIVDDGVDNRNPFLQGDRLLVPGGLPARRPHVGERQDHRRARVPRPELRSPGTRGVRPEHLVPRDARRGNRRRQRGHDRAGRPRPPEHARPLRRRAARVDRQLPRLQRTDADRLRRERRRDHRGLRGRRAGRDGRDQLLRRRRDDRARRRSDPRGGRERRRAQASSPSSRPGTTATSSASARSARPASPKTRSPSPRSRTRTSSRRRCMSSPPTRRCRCRRCRWRAAFDAPATDQQRTLIDVTTIMGRTDGRWTRASAVSASTRTTRPRTRSRRARSPGWSRSRRAASARSSRRPSARRPPARSG